MTLSLNERSPDLLQIIKDVVQSEIANCWTALPCEVVKYNSEALTITAQPLIKIPIGLSDGTIETVELPLLLDVPVMFPMAGGFTITHPINQGDECYVSFADRSIDVWWQSGGIQNPFDTRKHDLSDGFAFFRPQSQLKKISNVSTEDLEIRTDDNSTKIQMKQNGEIHFIGTKSVFHHPVEMKSTLTVQGLVKSLTDVVAKAISLLTHKHDSVQSGNSDTGSPK